MADPPPRSVSADSPQESVSADSSSRSVSGLGLGLGPPSLTPAELTLMRASVRVRCGDGTFALAVPPFICLSVSGLWELHAYGKLQARCPTLEPVAACVYRESVEPGWIAYALGASTDPEEACADGHTRQQAELHRVAAAASRQQREREADDAAWRKRRLSQINPTVISLDDLLGD